MKIVFIDIDGPLLPARAWMLPNNQHLLKTSKEFGHPFRHPGLHTLVQFDPVAVSFFNKWFEDPDVHGVISSNWVHYATKVQLENIFRNNGMNIRLHEDWVTPRKMSSNRLQEIWFWLGDHDVESYIVVDDDPCLDMFEPSVARFIEEPLLSKLDISERLLYVEYTNGLDFGHFVKGCKILGTDVGDVPHLTYQGKQTYV